MSREDQIKPSKKFYFIGIAIIILSIIEGVILLVTGITGMNDEGFRLVAPSTYETELEEGTYTVFYEYRSNFEGEVYNTEYADVSGLMLAVYDKTNREIIDVTSPTGSSNYTIGGRSGYSVLEFEIEESANVKIDTWYESGDGTAVVLNIQSGFMGGLMGSVLGFFIVTFGGIALGVIFMVVVSTKRNRAIRQMKFEQSGNDINAEDVERQTITIRNDNNEMNRDNRTTEEKSSKLWQQFLDNRAIDDTDYDVWGFGDNPEMATELAELVVAKKKTATSSLYKLYELDNEDIPRKGEYSVIIDGAEQERCIIQTSNVKVIPFNEVDEVFAAKEGEGDLSLYYWQRVHREFFTKALEEYNLEFNEDMLVVLEEFELMFK